MTFSNAVLKHDADGLAYKMRDITFLVAFCLQFAICCDFDCIFKRLEYLERRYDADLSFQELTRIAHEEFEDQIETILVSFRFVLVVVHDMIRTGD